jgi:hypothetical protein
VSSSALRQLLDRDKAVRAREMALKEQEAELAELRSYREAVRKNPLQTLGKEGITYDQLTRQAAAGEKPDPIEPVSRELQDLRLQVEEMQRREQEYQQERLLKQERTRIRSQIEESDKFSLIRATESHDAVTDLMLQRYAQTGEWTTWEDNAALVEQQLQELSKRFTSVQTPPAPTPPTPPAIPQIEESGYRREPVSPLHGYDPARVNREAAKLLKLKVSD